MELQESYAALLTRASGRATDDDDDVGLNVLRCRADIYQEQLRAE